MNWICTTCNSPISSWQWLKHCYSGAKVKGPLPFLINLFSQFTTVFKINATYKDSMQRFIRNAFGKFAQAFNNL